MPTEGEQETWVWTRRAEAAMEQDARLLAREPVGTSAEPLTLEMMEEGISLLRKHSSFDADVITVPEEQDDFYTRFMY